MSTTAAALTLKGATLTGARLRHLKTVGNGISALSPVLWLRQAGFTATPGGVITSWPSEVGGFAPENASWHDTNFTAGGRPTSLLVVPNAFKNTDVPRFGQDLAGANERDVGLWNAHNAAFDLGTAVGGLTIAAVVRLLPPVGSVTNSSNQNLVMLGLGDPAVSSTFDYGITYQYGTSSPTFDLNFSSGSQAMGSAAALQNAFGFVCFAVNQTGSGSGAIDGYINAAQVVSAAAYAGKGAASSSYPLSIGRSQGSPGASSSFGQFDLAELAVFQAYLNSSQVSQVFNSMMGNL
jgi:hypothetical protein